MLTCDAPGVIVPVKWLAPPEIVPAGPVSPCTSDELLIVMLPLLKTSPLLLARPHPG